MKNILIVSTSLRAGSNSEILAKEVYKGATEAGNSVEFLSLKEMNLKYCVGCLACQKLGKCAIDDDMKNVLDKVSNAEVIVFATPIYYYEMSGAMKTFLDRCNPLYGKDNKFKDIYLIAACADDNKNALDRAINGLGGWIDCFDDVTFKGAIYGVETNEPNEAKTKKDLLQEAYNLGKSL